MSIMTKKMAARESVNPFPYINSSNVLVGDCSPLKHFFCLNSRVYVEGVSDRVTDAIGGVVIEIDGETEPGYMVGTGITTDRWVSGTIVLGNSDMLIVVAGIASSGQALGVQFGAYQTAGQDGIRCSAGAATVSGIRDSALGADAVAAAGTQVALAAGVVAVGLDRSDTIACISMTTGAATVGTQSSATTTTAAGTIAIDNYVTTVGSVKAFGAFEFANGLPSNWKALAAWMGWEWANGNYVFPANWDGS